MCGISFKIKLICGLCDENKMIWICGVLGRPPSGVWHQGSARCLVATEGQLGAGGAGHLEGSRAEPLFKAV